MTTTLRMAQSRWRTRIVLLGMCAVTSSLALADSLRVVHPKSIPADLIDCQRVGLGEPDDYKPCVVALPDGSLRLVAFHQFRKDGDKLLAWKPGQPGLVEQMLMFRSDDAGRTWSRAVRVNLLGREPYFSVLRDGTLFITTALIDLDIRNTSGKTESYLHRSTDGGLTWETTPLKLDVPGKNWVVSSRNVLELADGTLILGVSSVGDRDFLWRSHDKGKTWDRSLTCSFQGVDKSRIWWPFMGETVFWQAGNGDLLGLWRVDHLVFPLPGAAPPKQRDDTYERMIVFRSKDAGRTWTREPELGSGYTEYYPSILRLSGSGGGGGARLLLTFTVRGRVSQQQIGVQAVLGRETPDGFTFDFTSHRLILDDRTPANQQQGGGFGPTVQTMDGTLVTSYSYRGSDGKTHLEVVRWKLPPGPGGR
jgi:hypothetical protein